MPIDSSDSAIKVLILYHLTYTYIKKTWESVLITRPTYRGFSHCPPIQNEQREAPRQLYIRHHTPHPHTGKRAYMHKYTTRGIHRCFVFE